MGIEIERKFLVRSMPDLHDRQGTPMLQAYLRTDAGGSVRVRISGDRAWLTIKGPTRDHTRLEFEYPLPIADARAMLDTVTVGQPVEKVRYCIEHGGYVWEVDVFSGANEGLILAEVELRSADDRPSLPGWVGREVSGDPRYSNGRLARAPYRTWPR